jgi:hypothetical protein
MSPLSELDELIAREQAIPRTLCVVHLVWAPLGPEPVRAFLRSYQSHTAGVEHELAIVLNGAARSRDGRVPLTRDRLLVELTGVRHRLIELDRPVPDLAAYGLAARTLPHSHLCFLNSYSVVLADDWLVKLVRALDDPDTGLAGATASWESQARWVRGRARYWPYQLATVRGARRDYPPYPNPHIRTTAFVLARQIVLALHLDDAQDKRATYLLESGRRNITRQVLDRGLRAVVVGRDGHPYGVKDWAAARTYRSGGQENLLVADRRTSDWHTASPRVRRRLSRDAWGEHYLGPGGIEAEVS